MMVDHAAYWLTFVVFFYAVAFLIYYAAGMIKMVRWNNDPRQHELIELLVAAGRDKTRSSEDIIDFLRRQDDWNLIDHQRRMAHAMTVVEKLSEPTGYQRANEMTLDIAARINKRLPGQQWFGFAAAHLQFLLPTLIISRIARFMSGNDLILWVMPVLVTYAGFRAWPLYTIILLGAGAALWNLLYFGTAALRVASGGPLAYLLRMASVNSVLAATLYGTGFGVRWFLGSW